MDDNSLVNIKQIGEVSDDLYLIYHAGMHKFQYLSAAFSRISIIKTIVELHGGQISFKSEVDAGSTFYITIPK